MAKKTPAQWFAEYGESHQHPVNKLMHWICVPLIVASVVGLLWDIPVPSPLNGYPFLNWSTLVIALCMVFYVRLSIPLAVGMLFCVCVVVGVIAWYERSGPGPVWVAALVVFVTAWAGQFAGHQIEGKKPSFLQDLQFLLIGPIWLLGFIYEKLGIRY